MSEEIGSGTKMNYGTTTKVGNQEEPTETERKLDKVISGEVIERKKGLGRKISETFMGVDARAVGTHVVFDVILPQLKGMAVDAGTQALERLILGDSAGIRRSSSSSSTSATRGRGSSYTAYNRYSGNSAPVNDEPAYVKSSDVREVIVDTRGDAQNVLDEMFRHLDQYKTVSVAEFYDLVGVTGRFTDNQWGWTNLNAAGVSRVREGFRIELPRPISLK